MKKVVITGMGCVSPFGIGVRTLHTNILVHSNYTTPVSIRVGKDKYKDYTAGLVPEIDTSDIPRHILRTMTKSSIYAYLATKEALDSCYTFDINSTRVGVSIASTLPSIEALSEYISLYNNNPKQISASSVFKLMNNSIGFNIANAFNLEGRIINSSSACASSIQSVILGYESIQLGKAEVMICGGTEEYSELLLYTFHKLGIASNTSCRPFQNDRDGIIVSEGAGILILEEYEHAISRNANIIAEVIGTGMNNTSNNVFSDRHSINTCMTQACHSLPFNTPIDVIDTHATGTSIGDNEEAIAISLLNDKVDINNIIGLKNYIGHTMAACGVIELINTIKCINNNILLPLSNNYIPIDNFNTLNSVEYAITTSRKYIRNTPKYILKNSFGLGGTNTSLLIRTT